MSSPWEAAAEPILSIGALSAVGYVAARTGVALDTDNTKALATINYW
jgi:predicted permease